MTKEDKKQLRGDLFRHLDGIVTAPIAYAIHKSGIFQFILDKGSTSLSEITQKFKAHEGYLNVALRVLASQGWLEYKVDDTDHITIETNDETAIAASYIPIYEDVVTLLKESEKYHPRKFEVDPFNLLESIFRKYQSRYNMASGDEATTGIQDQVLKHIEGIIVGPTVVALGMTGMFHNYFMEASFHPGEFHADAENFGRMLDIFVDLGWFSKSTDTYTFTEKGLFYTRRASAYGVTVSYIPMFRKTEELLFGDPEILWKDTPGEKEIHVDREMNVWGSGGAHAAYFKIIDEIIIDLFNQPIDQQPKGIVDMGCGNGAFLIHLFEVIENRTLRGKMLEEHPLFLVGADYNQAALKVTRSNIVQAGIWAKLVWGDIGRPDLLAEDLKNKYNIELSELLNVRTFLDHNRIWEDIKDSPESTGSSTGAFAFRGRRINRDTVEQNLVDHFRKWAPYVEKFGLLVIELHTIPPEITAGNLGRTAATAYDATHGFSDQYIVEIDVFHRAAKKAGLRLSTNHFRRFPDSELATVSVNLLKA